MPSETLARIGLSCGSKNSSVISISVIRTGVIRCWLHANTVSEESMGRISIVPTSDSTSFAISTLLAGYTSNSSADSCGWMPRLMATGSAAAS